MPAPIDALLVGGNTFPFHRFEDAEPMLVDAFADDIQLTTTTDKESLCDLEAYDVVIDYLTDHTLTAEQRRNFLAFVRSGGGYVGVHCASVLTTVAPEDPEETTGRRDEPFPELRDLLGGHFITHPAAREFSVRISDHEHPITAGLDDFGVEDEPYRLDVDEGLSVLARMDESGELEGMPVTWVKPYGEGRVFYCSLGHTEDALTHPTVRSMFSRGTRWAAGRETVRV